LKLTTYIIVSVLLFSFSSAANKSITELGEVQIEDLFYNSDSPLIPAEIEKIELYQVDKILEKNEDLELESLEIADIDLSTFGEYEEFLNKYYDDNYTAINSKFIKQFELGISGSGGITIPFGANVSQFHSTGSNFGIRIDPPFDFYIKNKLVDLVSEVNFSTMTSTHPDVFDYRIVNIMGSAKMNFNNYLYSRLNLSVISSKSGQTNNETSGWGFSGGVDFGVEFNLTGINIGTYIRAQSILTGLLDPPMYGGGTGEILSIGISFGKPFFLLY
jgi:hypothetical protein